MMQHLLKHAEDDCPTRDYVIFKKISSNIACFSKLIERVIRNDIIIIALITQHFSQFS